MDIETIIEEEYEAFFEQHFAKELEELEEALGFIDEYALATPSKSYYRAFGFLKELFMEFKGVHMHFCSAATDTLFAYIKRLAALYEEVVAQKERVYRVFERSFVHQSQTLSTLRYELADLELKQKRDALLKRRYGEFLSSYNRLESLYYYIFERRFYSDVQMVAQEYLSALNCYIYHFDAMLWRDAKRSLAILRYLEGNASNASNSKELLRYRLKTLHKETQKYHNLQLLLRIYA